LFPALCEKAYLPMRTDSPHRLFSGGFKIEAPRRLGNKNRLGILQCPADF
jgi:hypothetical protein